MPEGSAEVNHQHLFLSYPGKPLKVRELIADLTVIIDRNRTFVIHSDEHPAKTDRGVMASGSLQTEKIVRFGPFEANLQTGELRKFGIRIRLGKQPTQILTTLLENPGDVITREELRGRLWTADTFVEFENGLNNAMKKLRAALGDSAERPLYIETVPRVGYRFVAPVSGVREDQVTKDDTAQQVVEDAPRSVKLWPWVGAVGVLLSILAAYALLAPAAVPHATDFIQRPVSEHLDGSARLVTDGVRVYFLERIDGRDHLVQTSTAGGATNIVETPFTNTRVFGISPDRSEFLIGSFEEPRTGLPLWIWPVQGGSPIRVGGVVADDASWAPNAQQILYARGSDIHVVGRDGTGDRILIHTEGVPYWIRFSPDGKRMTFSVDSFQSEAKSLWEAAADGSNPHVRFPHWSDPPVECCAEWTPDGRYLVFESSHGGFENLWAIREHRGLFHWRAPVPVQLTPTARALGSGVLTRNGTRAFVTSGNEAAEFARYDLGSQSLVPLGIAHGALAAIPSPDGQWTAVIKSDWTLWCMRVDHRASVQLTTPPLLAAQPQWSPDGAKIAFEGRALGKPVRAYVVNAGGGPIEEISPDKGEQSLPTWSPNGSQLALAMNVDAPDNSRTARGIYVIDWKGRTSKKLSGSEGLTSPMWSPDGKYFTAKTADEKAILAFDAQRQKWNTIARGAVLSGLMWSRDSKYLYVQYLADEGAPIYRLWAGNFKPERVATFESALKQGIESCVLEPWSADGSLMMRIKSSSGHVYALDLNFP